MTLIERWENFENAKIISEMQQILMNYANWDELFCVDSNMQKIRYCVDHSSDESVETYGKKAGICFSEELARKCVKSALEDYTFLLIPWFYNDTNEIDLCIRLNFPIGYCSENGVEKEFLDVIIKFEKCQNRAGFCVSKIIPVR